MTGVEKNGDIEVRKGCLDDGADEEAGGGGQIIFSGGNMDEERHSGEAEAGQSHERVTIEFRCLLLSAVGGVRAWGSDSCRGLRKERL